MMNKILELVVFSQDLLVTDRDWGEFFVEETMAPYLTTSRGHFRE